MEKATDKGLKMRSADYENRLSLKEKTKTTGKKGFASSEDCSTKNDPNVESWGPTVTDFKQLDKVKSNREVAGSKLLSKGGVDSSKSKEKEKKVYEYNETDEFSKALSKLDNLSIKKSPVNVKKKTPEKSSLPGNPNKTSTKENDTTSSSKSINNSKLSLKEGVEMDKLKEKEKGFSIYNETDEFSQALSELDNLSIKKFPNKKGTPDKDSSLGNPNKVSTKEKDTSSSKFKCETYDTNLITKSKSKTDVSPIDSTVISDSEEEFQEDSYDKKMMKTFDKKLESLSKTKIVNNSTENANQRSKTYHDQKTEGDHDDLTFNALARKANDIDPKINIARLMRQKEALESELAQIQSRLKGIKLDCLPDKGERFLTNIKAKKDHIKYIEENIIAAQAVSTDSKTKPTSQYSSASFSGYRSQSDSVGNVQPKPVMVDVPKVGAEVTVSSNSVPQKQSLMTEYATGGAREHSSANPPQGRQTIMLQNMPQISHLPEHIQQFYAANPQAMTLYGGRMTTQRLREVGSITAEAIDKLHKQLETRPSDETEAEDPKGLKVKLMAHQRHALAWLAWREQQSPPGGILADDMGLGKTLTAISHVLNMKQAREETDENGWISREKELKKLSKAIKKSKATLIVAPASLVHQWGKEVERRCERSALKVHLYHGPTRETNLQRLIKNDIVITSYSIVAREVGQDKTQSAEDPVTDRADDCDDSDHSSQAELPLLLKIGWERIILDEGHNIKNHKSSTAMSVCRLRAAYRFVLTGTPIQNNLLDMYSLLRFLRFSPFDEYKVWKKQIDTSRGETKRLNTIVKALLLRRTKEDTSKEGKKLVDLPSKTIQTIDVVLSEEERKVYDKLFKKSQRKVQEYIQRHEEKESGDLPSSNYSQQPVHREQHLVSQLMDTVGDRIACKFCSDTFSIHHNIKTLLRHHEREHPLMIRDARRNSPPQPVQQNPSFQTGLVAASTLAPSQPTPVNNRNTGSDILVMLLRLRQCCSHLSLMKEDLESEAMETDGIELSLEEQMKGLGLGDTDHTQTDGTETKPKYNKTTVSTKLKSLIDKIESLKSTDSKQMTEKCVVVSQWTKMLDIVGCHLSRIGVNYSLIQGNIPAKKRMDIVDDFNLNPKGAQVVLVSLRAGGVGLNLIGGNHLFLLDNHWNPALEDQACDRIYRMGQKKDVFIYRYLCKDTIEEKIVALQKNKTMLAKSVLSGANVKSQKLTLHDLRSLFGV